MKKEELQNLGIDKNWIAINIERLKLKPGEETIIVTENGKKVEVKIGKIDEEAIIWD